MKFLYLYLIVFAFLSGCATAKTYQGACVHPLLGGGMPLNLDDSIDLDGSLVHFKDSEGGTVTVTGAACIYKEKK